MKSFLLALAAFGALAACAGTAGVPALQSGGTAALPTAASSSSASPAQFAVSTIVTAAASMSLPVGGGYAGTFAVGGTIQPFTQVTETLQNTLPTSLPSLSSKRNTLAQRSKLDIGSGQALVYFGVNGTARLPGLGTFTPPATFPPSLPADPPPSAVSVTLTIPAGVQVPGASYYLAFYDPLRPSLGWQLGFEGPSQSGSTLTFTGNAATFIAYQQYWFAVYVAATAGSAPTAAPSIPPIATPSPAPATLTDLQNTMGLTTTCSGTPCATGPLATPQPGATGPPPTPQPTATYSIATGVNMPLLSGTSTRLTVVADNNHEDVLFYTPPQPFLSPLATSFTWDFYFVIDQPLVDATRKPVGPVEALEFDSNIGLPGFGYNLSSQCVIQTGNVWAWQIWGYTGNGSAQNWVNSGIACDPALFTPNTLHHIVWTYSITPDLMKKQYLNLSFDNINYVPTQNAIGQAEPRSGQKTFVEVQFQIDARPVSTTNTTPVFNEWVGNVTFSYR